MARSPVYFSETLTVGKRTYLMEVRRNQRGEKYFILKRTDLRDEEQEPVLVFDRFMTRFAGSIDRATRAMLNTVPEVDTADERKAKRQAAAIAKQDRPKNQGKRWTKQDDAALTAGFHDGLSVDELASQLGRGVFSIEVRLSKLGLKRDER